MSHVDALSRAPTENTTDTLHEIIANRLEVFATLTEEQYVKSMQYGDSEIMGIIKSLERSSPSKLLLNNYNVINGVLYRRVQTVAGPWKLWMVPKCTRKSLAIKFHDLGGHFVVDRTYAKITVRYYFPRMWRYLRVHIEMCPEYALYKKSRGRQAGMLHPTSPGERPFETINIDHLGPFPKSTKGNAYILVLVDNLTKFVKLNASKTVQSFALRYGLPKRIITDRGTAFQSEQFWQ